MQLKKKKKADDGQVAIRSYIPQKKFQPVKFVGYLGYCKGSVYCKKYDLLMQAFYHPHRVYQTSTKFMQQELGLLRPQT